MRCNHLFATALLACALSAACNDAGTSTGNPAPLDGGDRGSETDNGGGLAGGYCKAGEATPLALDEDSPLGFSAEDILAFSAGAHVEPLRWSTVDNVQLAPETGLGEVTITVTSKGTARHVEPDTSNPTGQENFLGGLAIDGIGGCRPWLEIDVEVAVTSAGGALDERFDGLLRAQHALHASLLQAIDPEDLGGAFSVTASGALAGFELAGTSLSLSFSPYSMGGTFGGYFTKDDGMSATAGFGRGPFAEFGAGKCTEGGFTVGADDAIEGVTASDVLDAVAAHDALALTWEDGAETTAALAFTAGAQGGCVLLGGEGAGTIRLAIEGTVALASADARLDGSWPGSIAAYVVGGAIERIELRLADHLMSNVMLGGDYYGFPSEDLSSYDAASISVGITVLDASVEGTVTLTGYRFADCARPEPQQDPDADPAMGMGAGGCRGADAFVLARGTLE